MCTYCFIADWMHEYTWGPNPLHIPGTPWSPFGPLKVDPVQPVVPTTLPAPGWTRKQLDEAVEILRKVKEMEDALGGCPCEDPTKLNFLDEIRSRLDALEKAQKAKKDEDESNPTHFVSY